MKISKQRIQEIIKEELSLAEAEVQQSNDEQDLESNQSNQEKDVDTRQKLALKFKELAKLLPRAQGVDSAEAKLIDAIIDKIIADSNKDNAKAILIVALKKLGVKV